MATKSGSTLAALSADIAALTTGVGESTVRVDDGTRLTATGVIWTEDGTIVATSHGIEVDEGVAVELADGTRLEATVVGRDDEADIAVLKVNAAPSAPNSAGTGLKAIARAGVDEAQVGQLALAVGRPGDRGLVASLGMVTARLDAQSNGSPEYVLHTDATLYPGFSGGALVNPEGRLIGLLNLAMGRREGVALGTSLVEHVVDQIIAGGGGKRGYLGVTTQPAELSAGLRKSTGTEQSHGLLISAVGDGSPAEQAGVLVGDIILAVESDAVDNPERLRRRLRKFVAGQSVTVTVARGGQKVEVKATLGSAE